MSVRAASTPVARRRRRGCDEMLGDARDERYAQAPDATALVPPELAIALVERTLGVEAGIERSTR